MSKYDHVESNHGNTYHISSSSGSGSNNFNTNTSRRIIRPQQLFTALIYIAIGCVLSSSFSFWSSSNIMLKLAYTSCQQPSVQTHNEKQQPLYSAPDISSSITPGISASNNTAEEEEQQQNSLFLDQYDAIAQAIEVQKLRVYTYPLPSTFNSDFNIPGQTKYNNDRMLAAERRIHELFQTPGIATDNMEVADFFFVPIYPASACAYHKLNCTTWNERPDCYGCKQGYTLIEESIRYLQNNHNYRFTRHNGKDHIFPVFYDHGVCMETFREDAERVKVPSEIQNSILLGHLGDDSYGCYRSGQDIVLPPFVDDVSSASGASRRRSLNDDILMYFRGNTELHPSSPQTRKKLVGQYSLEPSSIVTDAKVDTSQMHSELERSTFCLVPAGFASWSYRMVEAIKFECIPVFFDDTDMPFSSVIDYNLLGLKVSDQTDSIPNLIDRITGLSAEEIATKRDYIRKVKPLFTYYSKEFQYTLMTELYKRRVAPSEPTPVESKPTTFDFDVDFVYTWVNGSDPDWLTTKAKFQGILNSSDVNADSIANMRFRDREELRYSLRSIQKNAPWVRKVHIVVAGDQKPSWANIKHPMINIVRHEDIFPKRFPTRRRTLPTYNSFAIEQYIDNIPGLSEHFVLMNDDFFIGRPVEKSKFFTFEGYPKVAFQDNWLVQSRVCRANLTGSSANHSYLWAALNTYRLLDETYGHEERRLVMHQAYPLTKSLYRKAKDLFPMAFKTTAMNRFRTREDFIPVFLALYSGFHYGTAVKLRPAEYPTNTAVQFGDDFEKNSEMINSFDPTQYDVFFINDHTSDTASEEDLDKLTVDMQSWMANMFPELSQFEK